MLSEVVDRVVAVPGMAVSELDTPCLVIDLDAMERNIAAMSAFARQHQIMWRPHAKMHKCAALANQLIAAGAVGCCVQKVSEAEAMAQGGVRDIYISNEVISESKLARVAQLASDLRNANGRLAIAVDSLLGIERLAQAMRAHSPSESVSIDVFIEINVGQNRSGVEPGDAAVPLAHAIVQHAPQLRFAGLQAYHGGAQHIEVVAQRQDVMQQVYEKVQRTLQALKKHGWQDVLVTGAGTGTFAQETQSGYYNELQPGSFLFMDAHYARVAPDAAKPVFEHALFVKTQVMSVQADRAVCDAGHKSHAIDSGLPTVWNGGLPAVLAFGNGGDEHGILTLTADAGTEHQLLNLGDTLWLVPGHCDPTVNLHSTMIGVRGGLQQGVVETVFTVDARGALS